MPGAHICCLVASAVVFGKSMAIPAACTSGRWCSTASRTVESGAGIVSWAAISSAMVVSSGHTRARPPMSAMRPSVVVIFGTDTLQDLRHGLFQAVTRSSGMRRSSSQAVSIRAIIREV